MSFQCRRVEQNNFLSVEKCLLVLRRTVFIISCIINEVVKSKDGQCCSSPVQLLWNGCFFCHAWKCQRHRPLCFRWAQKDPEGQEPETKSRLTPQVGVMALSVWWSLPMIELSNLNIAQSTAEETSTLQLIIISWSIKLLLLFKCFPNPKTFSLLNAEKRQLLY